MKEASLRAISELDEQKEHLLSIELDPELERLKQADLEVISNTQKYFDGIENRQDEENGRIFSELRNEYASYTNELTQVLADKGISKDDTD